MQIANNLTVQGTLTATGAIAGAAGFVTLSAATAIASAGSTVTDATALTKGINNVTTVSANTTGVKLPLVATVGVGGFVVVLNTSATSMHVYGLGSDTVDGIAAGTGTTQAGGTRAIYFAVAAATYISLAGAAST